jgi:hypothetical protein
VTCDAVAGLLGYDTGWRPTMDTTRPDQDHHQMGALLARHAETAVAVAALLTRKPVG